MATITPYFFQYEVRPNSRNEQYQQLAGAIATIIVFAETAELARARATRHVGRNNWEIVEVKRTMTMCKFQIERLDGVLKSLYIEAEQTGIGALFEGWKKPGQESGS